MQAKIISVIKFHTPRNTLIASGIRKNLTPYPLLLCCFMQAEQLSQGTKSSKASVIVHFFWQGTKLYRTVVQQTKTYRRESLILFKKLLFRVGDFPHWSSFENGLLQILVFLWFVSCHNPNYFNSNLLLNIYACKYVFKVVGINQIFSVLSPGSCKPFRTPPKLGR